MSDDPILAALARIENRLTGLEVGQVQLKEAIMVGEARLMTRLNNSEERILNRLTAMEADWTNTKNFLLNDAAIATRRWLDLESRVSKLEGGK